MSITVPQKKRGRPPTGERQRIPVRLDDDAVAAIDYFCGHAGTSRSDVVREAVEMWRRAYADELPEALRLDR